MKHNTNSRTPTKGRSHLNNDDDTTTTTSPLTSDSTLPLLSNHNNNNTIKSHSTTTTNRLYQHINNTDNNNNDEMNDDQYHSPRTITITTTTKTPSSSSSSLLGSLCCSYKLTKRIRRIINSQVFHLMSIVLTLLAIGLSMISKTLFERNTTSKSHVVHYLAFSLSSVYMLMSTWFCIEVSSRMIFNGAHFFWRQNKGVRIRNLAEFFIVWISFALDLYAYIRLASSIVVIAKRDQMVTSTLLGSIITMRIAIFLLATPALHSLIRQMKNAFETVLIVLMFCACLLYGASLLSFFLFNPNLFHSGSSSGNCEICRDRFNNVENSFFAMLQVISSDGWSSDIVVPMCEQSSFSCAFIWLYFGSIECFSLFILLNVFTGVIFESLLQTNTDPSRKKTNYSILADMACGLCSMSKYVAKRQRHEADPKTTSRALKKFVNAVTVSNGDEDDDEESESDDEAFRLSMLDSANDRRHKEVMRVLVNMNREMLGMKRELNQLKKRASKKAAEEE